MLRRNALAMLAGMALLLAGCAHGPRYDEVAATFPKLKPGFGRVFFFRSGPNFASLGEVPDFIWVDSRVVGDSRPGSFFFADLRPGFHEAVAVQSWENSIQFSVRAGETIYIRTGPNLVTTLLTMDGSSVPPVGFLQEDPALAQVEIRKLIYTGQVSEELRDMSPPKRPKEPGTTQKTRKQARRKTAK